MTTSPHMPDVLVEVAWDSGWATADVDRTWTDVSEWVELAANIGVGFGRSDERSTADANSLSLTFDNTDGRFTAGLTSSPYYPNVKIGRPIRVTSTPPGGAASVRFVGYVDEWPVEWDGSDAYASAAITATSRLARLGLSTSLRSVVEEEILADSPTAYYPMSEATGATSAADCSGNSAPALLRQGRGDSPVFGVATGPGTDGLTAVTLSGGKHLGRASVGVTSDITADMFFLRNTPPALTEALLTYEGVLAVVMNTAGQIVVWSGLSVAIITSASSYADGATHHLAVTRTIAGAFELFVDGVSRGTASPGIAIDVNWARSVGGGIDGLETFTGTLAHVATYSVALAAARVAAHSASGATGFEGETTDARILRYAQWADMPATEVAVEAGSETIVHIDPTGGAVVDLMRTVETTEAGVLFDERDGTLTFQNRGHRYQASVALTLDMAAQMVESGYAPKLDRSTLVNDATGTNAGGTITARVTDVASRDDYGVAAASFETASTSEHAPYEGAAWLVNTYSTPTARVPDLTVDLLGMGIQTDAALALTIGDRISVRNHPSQAAATDIDYFVEGCSESIGHESYALTFNLSPADPYLTTLILDHATRAELDAGYSLAF